MKRATRAVLLTALAVCFLPLVAVVASSWFAQWNGCTLHEGFANPCVVNGVDYGDTLSTLFVSGWFMMLTLPVAFILVIILGVMGLRDLIRRRG